MLADLHIHTNASDGTFTPAEVVKMAVKSALRCIAITDHDTMEGTFAARTEAQLMGLEVLDGVELSTELNGLEIHILGYCIDPQDKHFQEHLTVFQNARLNRTISIIAKLKNLGLEISLDHVLELAGSGSVGRPHIAKALVAVGKVKNVAEAFENYIGVGKPAYEPRLKYHPVEMVKLIKGVGGVPVLAHPGITCDDKTISLLIEGGLQGVEVFHPQHSLEMEKHYQDMCHKKGLVATGGSDFHGLGVAKHGKLGEAVVSYDAVKEIRRLASLNKRVKYS